MATTLSEQSRKVSSIVAELERALDVLQELRVASFADVTAGSDDEHDEVDWLPALETIVSREETRDVEHGNISARWGAVRRGR